MERNFLSRSFDELELEDFIHTIHVQLSTTFQVDNGG
jgi:hypothetical protein